MTIKRKSSSSQPDGCIYEQFGYNAKLEEYPQSTADINELADIEGFGRNNRRSQKWKSC